MVDELFEEGGLKVKVKIRLAGMAVVASLVIILGSGCAPAPVEQPKPTRYMQSAVGTPDEMCPLVPGEARNVRKVGNHWTCEINGQPMVYNDAASRWEPQAQAGQKK
jgi:hypothetical protein